MAQNLIASFGGTLDVQENQTAELSPRKKHRKRRKKTTLKSLKDQIKALKASQSSGESTTLSASPSSEPAEHPASREFAEESAAIVAEAGAVPSDVGDGELPTMPGQKLQLPWGMEIDITQQNIREHYLPTMFKALAKGFGEDFDIEEWEKEIWAPALTGVANRYLPDLLSKTDRPELVLLATAVFTYTGTRIGAIRRVIKQRSSERVTSIPGSPDTSTFSGSPDAAKLT